MFFYIFIKHSISYVQISELGTMEGKKSES